MFHDCSKVVESYLLYQNPLYAFSLPISLIIAIIVYGICISMKCSSNSYIYLLYKNNLFLYNSFLIKYLIKFYFIYLRIFILFEPPLKRI